MKQCLSCHQQSFFFLSDLCDREDAVVLGANSVDFLSDLCGREARSFLSPIRKRFLSDLCGREVYFYFIAFIQVFSKRPVRS